LGKEGSCLNVVVIGGKELLRTQGRKHWGKKIRGALGGKVARTT